MVSDIRHIGSSVPKARIQSIRYMAAVTHTVSGKNNKK